MTFVVCDLPSLFPLASRMITSQNGSDLFPEFFAGKFLPLTTNKELEGILCCLVVPSV
jgi:hypothetical protein